MSELIDTPTEPASSPTRCEPNTLQTGQGATEQGAKGKGATGKGATGGGATGVARRGGRKPIGLRHSHCDA